MRWAGVLAAVCWIVFSITLIIFMIAGDGGYLAGEMLKYAPPEISRLPAEEYPGVGNMTAGYLTGRTERFQYEYIDVSGNTVACFHDYEEAHMADCRDLIRLDRTVMLVSGGALLVLICAGWRSFAALRMTKKALRMTSEEPGMTNGKSESAEEVRELARGLLWGLRAVIAAAVILAVWAVADFNGFFITFHRVAFTNDGWLLNPGTDMLIRLMPEAFFISLGIRGAVWALIAAAALRIVLKISGLRSADSGQ